MNKNKKFTLTVISLIIISVVSLTACGGQENNQVTEEIQIVESSETPDASQPTDSPVVPTITSTPYPTATVAPTQEYCPQLETDIGAVRNDGYDDVDPFFTSEYILPYLNSSLERESGSFTLSWGDENQYFIHATNLDSLYWKVSIYDGSPLREYGWLSSSIMQITIQFEGAVGHLHFHQDIEGSLYVLGDLPTHIAQQEAIYLSQDCDGQMKVKINDSWEDGFTHKKLLIEW